MCPRRSETSSVYMALRNSEPPANVGGSVHLRQFTALLTLRVFSVFHSWALAEVASQVAQVSVHSSRLS